MSSPHLQQCRDDLRVGLAGGMAWLTRSLLQTGRTIVKVAVDPLVAGLASDPVELAQLGGSERALQVVGDELRCLVHR